MKRNKETIVEIKGGLSGDEPVIVVDVSSSPIILSIDDARHLLESLSTCINITLTEYERWKGGRNKDKDT